MKPKAEEVVENIQIALAITGGLVWIGIFVVGLATVIAQVLKRVT